MQGITSLEGHGEANSRMRNSLRMVVPQLSPEQKEMITYLERIGHCVIVGKGATDASKQIMEVQKKWGNK